MNLLKRKLNKKGFTLAELLIVIAIIAILIAIAIPVFTTQLDKARTTTDEANARSALSLAEADWMLKRDEHTGTSGSVAGVTSGNIFYAFGVGTGENKNLNILSGYPSTTAPTASTPGVIKGESSDNKTKTIIVTINVTTDAATVAWTDAIS